MKVYLCEKPSQGKDIAQALGAHQRCDGYFQGQGTVVTWCIGHLIETAPPEAYNEAYKRWALADLPIVPTQWKMTVKKSTAKQFKVVKSLLAKATELIISTDADREGEMIARELVDLCNYRGSIKRLWLSALNEASIKKAMSQLKDGKETESLYYSALGRSRADWLIGMNLSRLFTLLGQQAGYHGVLTVGRVQTPTVKLVADRENEVSHFTPVPYWTVNVLLHTSQGFTARWICPEDYADERGRCLNQAIAEQAAQTIRASGAARVESVTLKREKEQPPIPFELGELQKICSARFGMGAQETLDTVQALYETHKATTYPRVDTGYLPENMHCEAPAILNALAKSDAALMGLIQQANPALRSPAWNDKKVTAHHGIIPTAETINLSALSDKERNVYELIKIRYLAQFFPAHEFDKTDAILTSAGHTLKASGKKIIIQGWKITQKQQADSDSDDTNDDASEKSGQILPPLEQGQQCSVQDARIKALQTKPPQLFTEGTLIEAMKNVARLVTDPRLKAKLRETTGIGTNATRASIIKNLLDRNLLVKKGKFLLASSEAHDLLKAVPPAISNPGTTAIWEQALDMVENNQLSLESFVQKQSTWIGNVVEKYKHLPLQIKVEPSPACPLCSSPTRKRKGSNGFFWGCSKYPDCKGIINIESKPRKKTNSRSRTAKT